MKGFADAIPVRQLSPVALIIKVKSLKASAACRSIAANPLSSLEISASTVPHNRDALRFALKGCGPGEPVGKNITQYFSEPQEDHRVIQRLQVWAEAS
jgi:hypothetical protein